MKRFVDLSEQEVLALAITNEEEDSRIYRGFAEGLRARIAAAVPEFAAAAGRVPVTARSSMMMSVVLPLPLAPRTSTSSPA